MIPASNSEANEKLFENLENQAFILLTGYDYRDSEFDRLIVKKNQLYVTGIEDHIVAMYAKRVSTRDIQDHLKQLISPFFVGTVI